MSLKKITRYLAPCAALLCAAALTGCLRFENSMDLSVPLTTGAGLTPAVTEANADATAAPAENSTAAPTPGENATDGADAASPADGTTADQAASTTAPNTENTTADQTASTTAANTENTTAAPAESTTAAGPMTAAQYAASLGATEYDTLRSKSMTINGVFGDKGEESPIVMSIGDGEIYMTSEMDGLEMGIYISGKKTYIYLPAHKKYLKLNAAVAKLMGIDPNEFSDMAQEMGFDSLPALSTAYDYADGAMNGKACKLFLLKGTDGTDTLRVGLNGKKLIGVEYLDAAGKTDSYMYFTSVQAGFPTMPPDGYEEMGYIDFAKLLMAEMDEG